MLGSFIAWVVEGAVWIGVGMVIGWNLLPQPVWVARYYDKVVEWLKSKMHK